MIGSIVCAVGLCGSRVQCYVGPHFPEECVKVSAREDSASLNDDENVPRVPNVGQPIGVSKAAYVDR